MKTYRVTVLRSKPEYVEIEVAANNEKQAGVMAVMQAWSPDFKIDDHGFLKAVNVAEIGTPTLVMAAI